MPDRFALLIYNIIEHNAAPVIAGGLILLGSPLFVAILFGVITKFLIYLFEKEIKKAALFARKKTDAIIAFYKRLRIKKNNK